MKQKEILIIVIGVSFMGLLPIGCQGNLEEDLAYTNVDASEYAQADSIGQNIVIDIRREVPTVLPTTPAPQAVIAPVVENDLPIESGVGPMVYAQSVFDDNIAIEPWRANYVGSYGVLPTRFGRAPFVYSFGISSDADVFNDDDERPIYEEELFWRGDDDN
jgi:hypothetical protein